MFRARRTSGEARPAGNGARGARGGEGERHTHLRDLSGLVDTELLENRPVKTRRRRSPRRCQPGDVAEAILFVAKLPARVVVPEMQVMPTYL